LRFRPQKAEFTATFFYHLENILRLKTAFSASAIAMASLFGMIQSANAADSYIFGYSGLNAGNRLNVNGSTFLSTIDSGWYNNSGAHDPSNTNYIVGSCCGASEFRNWFVFDISGLTSPVSSLSFDLYSYSVTLTSGNYYVNDVSTSVSSLVGGTGGLAAFNDLGSGSNYGFNFYQSGTDSNQFHTINLNSAAVSSLNTSIAANAGTWALGGAFAAGNVPVPPINAVPEAETYAMMIAGLGLMGAIARRRK
jgi:hypothetical protein